MNQSRLSIRQTACNPDHHLWNNHGTWWVHFTLHHGDHTKSRIRRSTGTSDLVTARRVRDALLTPVTACSW